MSEQPSQVARLVDLIDEAQVHALLLERAPDLFEPGPRADLLTQTKRGVAAEVNAITHGVPADPDVRELALWCAALGVAANIETALFPEQSLGDNGRAQVLQARYLGVRAQLAQEVSRASGGAGAGSGPKFAGFPPAQHWPDASVPVHLNGPYLPGYRW